MECKTTSKRTYTLRLEDIHKIRDEALEQGLEDWAMQVQFQGQGGIDDDYAIVDHKWFIDKTIGKAPYYIVQDLTDAKSYKLDQYVLFKVRGSAPKGHVPMFSIVFQNDLGGDWNYSVVPWARFLSVRGLS